jgi:hypothetical protein
MLLAVFIGIYHRKQGILFGFLSTLTAILLHAVFWLWTDGIYSPLHLVTSPKPFINPVVMILAIILCGLIGLYTVFNVKETRLSWLQFGWICIFVPVFILSLAELLFNQFNFAIWESANYLFSASPIFMMRFVLSLPQSQNRHS